MYQQPIPQSIACQSDEELAARITNLRESLGDQVLILGHHYQRDEVICHADFRGDSLKLAKLAHAQSQSPYIIFCGVHFMAETADILTSDDQQVCLPDLGAGCDMADMAHIRDVRQAWDDFQSEGFEHVVPVTYINSSAALKSFVGEHGGVICTSGNAEKIVTWALEHGRHLFFFPDQHLGRNIGKKLGLSPDRDMTLWDPSDDLGGNDVQKLQRSKIWLWKGHCPVHALFAVDQIERLHRDKPSTKVIVHPECSMEVCDRSDLMGSTEFILKTIADSGPGSSWAVGTEKHLVERLAQENPDKEIFSLNRFTCLCGTMNRITAQRLAWSLEALKEEPVNVIRVAEDAKVAARRALDRMFEIGS